MNEQQLEKLQEKLNYRFKDPSLLITALTHSSYANENKKMRLANNERLEFLGDSILGLAVAELIYNHKSKMHEGHMTKLRAELVCERSLATLATMLELGEYMLLGRGEEKGGGRRRPSILADAVEAILAAVYLDGGFDFVTAIVNEHLISGIEVTQFGTTDYKTALQEVVQMKPGQILSYHVTGESGPDHMKQFTAEVHLNNEFFGQGVGRSKKEAEQAAAMSALTETLPALNAKNKK
jgi:ribonuclease-3